MGRTAAAVAEVAALVTGTPPRLVGHGGGPLTALRRARHRRMHERRERPVRICLLEFPPGGEGFGEQMAFFVNERSSLCTAAVNAAAESADVVWVFSQDPLEDAVRRDLEAVLARVPPSTPVLNRPEHYDAYHRDDAFDRMEAAGVSVPRHRFGPQDVGRAEVVYKAQGEQGSTKFRAPYRGPVPGFRPFGLEDGSGPDGLVRRYRAWWLAGEAFPEQVILASGWNASLGSVAGVERVFSMTPLELEQVGLIAGTLGLDYFAVDYLRRRDDGLPVFLDVNVYPTIAEAYTLGLAGRGTWHLWDVAWRAGLPPAHGRDPWRVFDATMARLAGVAGRAPAPDYSGPST